MTAVQTIKHTKATVCRINSFITLGRVSLNGPSGRHYSCEPRGLKDVQVREHSVLGLLRNQPRIEQPLKEVLRRGDDLSHVRSLRNKGGNELDDNW